jgi:hypothetical protein
MKEAPKEFLQPLNLRFLVTDINFECREKRKEVKIV